MLEELKNSRMFGRDSERRRLEHFLSRVHAGQKIALLMFGDEGSGKSALARWLARHIGEMGGFVSVYVRASRLAFPATADLCRRIERELHLATRPLRGPGAPSKQALPSAPMPDANSETPALLQLVHSVETLSLDMPLVLILDDLDQIAASTTGLILEAARVQRSPIGVLAVGKTIDSLMGTSSQIVPSSDLWIETLHVEGLDVDSFQRLAIETLGGPLAPESLARVHSTCVGNPHLGIELLHHLRLNAQLSQVGDVYVLNAMVLDPGSLPDSLLGTFSLRLVALTETQRLILQLLALMRRPLSLAALLELVGVPEAVSHIAVLEEQHLIRADIDGYHITHPLYESAIVADLMPAARAFIHARLFDWLNRSAPDAHLFAEELALHAARSRMSSDRVTDSLIRAGDQAMGEGRYRDAADFLSQAEKQGPSKDQLPRLLLSLARTWEHIDPGRAVSYYGRALQAGGSDPSLLIRYASALRKIGNFSHALRVLESAASEATGSMAFEVRRAIGVVHAIRGDRIAAVQNFKQLGRAATTAAEKALADGHLAQALFLSGREVEGHAVIDSAFADLQDLSARLHAANNLAWMKIVLGYWPAADALLTSAVSQASEAGDYYHLGALLTIHARLAAWQGHLPESFERSTRATLITKSMRNPADVIGALDSLALSFLEADRPHDALGIIQELDSYLQEDLEPREIALTFVIAGDVHLSVGDIAQAVRYVDRAEEFLHEAEHLGIAARRLRAGISLREGRPTEVIDLLAPALADSGFLVEQAAAWAVFAQASSLIGAHDVAADAATRALRFYTGLGATRRAARVSAWLEHHRPRPRGRPRSTSPFGLTQREHEILWLVTQGRTNREIASALTISEGTVNKHVDNIKMKAQVSRRTALVTFAAKLGIRPDSPPEVVGMQRRDARNPTPRGKTRG